MVFSQSISFIATHHNTLTITPPWRNKSAKGDRHLVVSHHHRINPSSTFYENIYENKNVQTAIIPNGGDYVLKVDIGTPPVEFTSSVSTGRDLMWLQCEPCSQCIPQEVPYFNPNTSSSYNLVSCKSQACNQQGIESGCLNGSCTYGQNYGDGTESIGALSTDTIAFSSTSFPSFVFGCGFYQQGGLGIQGDGIAGLGPGPLSLVSQLRSNINYKFSYCLTPLTAGINSKLNFGLDVTRSGVVSTPFSNQDTSFYEVALDTISIGNTSVPVSSDIIIDSGTTLTFLPTDVYDAVRIAVKGDINRTTVEDPDQVFDPCYDASSLGQGFSPPDIVFHFSGADVVLKAENTFRTRNGLTCLTIVPTDDPPAVFGNIAQVNFEVGYDLQAQTVSFAPADCTTY